MLSAAILENSNSINPQNSAYAFLPVAPKSEVGQSVGANIKPLSLRKYQLALTLFYFYINMINKIIKV